MRVPIGRILNMLLNMVPAVVLVAIVTGFDKQSIQRQLVVAEKRLLEAEKRAVIADERNNERHNESAKNRHELSQRIKLNREEISDQVVDNRKFIHDIMKRTTATEAQLAEMRKPAP